MYTRQWYKMINCIKVAGEPAKSKQITLITISLTHLHHMIYTSIKGGNVKVHVVLCYANA